MPLTLYGIPSYIIIIITIIRFRFLHPGIIESELIKIYYRYIYIYIYICYLLYV